METVVAALPELHAVRNDAQAAPALGALDRGAVLGMALRERFEGGLELRARGDDLRLRAGRRAEPRVVRARDPVGVGLVLGDALDGALDEDLALEVDPREHDRRARVLRDLAALARIEVREEHQPA